MDAQNSNGNVNTNVDVKILNLKNDLIPLVISNMFINKIIILLCKFQVMKFGCARGKNWAHFECAKFCESLNGRNMFGHKIIFLTGN